MTVRHLLPNEIDLLVDGETGPGFAPLRAHLEECDDCRARFDMLRRVTGEMEALGSFTPNVRFAERVMTKVQVVEPWHVSVASAARRFIPESTPLRIAAGIAAGGVGLVISGSAVWLAFRADLASWTLGIVAESGRDALVATTGSMAANALGADGAAALAAGRTPVLLLAAGVLGLVAVGATYGFRRLIATTRAKQG